MTPTQDLKAAALAATPGPWTKGNGANKHRVYAAETENRLGMELHIRGNGNNDDNRKNARFIALANPATILALIERLQVAEDTAKDAERYRYLRDSEWEMFTSSWLNMHDLYGTEAKDMDAAIDHAIAARRLTP